MKLPQLLLVMAAGLLLAANVPSDDAKLEMHSLERLEGTWKVVSSEQGGEDSTRHFKDFMFVFTPSKLTLKDGAEVLSLATFKQDNSHKPSRIDLRIKGGQGKGATYLVIYALEGNRLKLCFGEVHGTRPTEFATKAGSSTTLFILKRTKP